MKYLLPSKFGSSEPHTSKCILPSTSKVEGEASRKIFLFAFDVPIFYVTMLLQLAHLQRDALFCANLCIKRHLR